MNKVEQGICRIRERLSHNDVVTHGVGCVVRNEKLAASLGWKCPNLIVTSVRVLKPQHLDSERIYFAEFFVLEKNGYEVFELNPAVEFCKVVTGRSIRKDEEDVQQANEQLTIISVEPLDKRGFLKRMVKKSSLQNTRPLDCFDFENFDKEMDSEGIFCNVIREFGSFAQEFESRTYKFRYDVKKKVYLLEDFGHRNIDLEVKSFPDDQILAGGIVFSKQGLFLGSLGFTMGQVLPSFIPDAYLELLEEGETLEEAPTEEEQAQNEVVTPVPDDNVKMLCTDENENRDLLEDDLESHPDSIIEETALSKELEPDKSGNQVEQELQEAPDFSGGEHLDSSQTQEVDKTDILKHDSENSKQISEDKRLEELENNPQILEMGRQESSDLEFVICVKHDHSEANENKVTEAEEATTNSNLIKENNTDENTREEETCTYEENESPIEIFERETQSEPEVEVPYIEESQENNSENVKGSTQEVIEAHKQDNTPNADQSDLVDESDLVAIETQVDSDIRESSDQGVSMEESCGFGEVSNPENVSQGESNTPESSSNALEIKAELSSTEIKSGENQDPIVEVDHKDSDKHCGSEQECNPVEDSPVLDQVELAVSQDELKPSPQEDALSDEMQEQNRGEGIHMEELPEQELNTEKTVETQALGELPDSDNQAENDLIEEIDCVHETANLNPPHAVEMEATKDVLELDKTVKQDLGDPLKPDDLLSITITENPKVLEDLSLLLDTDHQHGGVSSWHDLAELLAIPKEAYDHCLSFSKPSPTEDLMVFLSNTKPQFTVSELKDALRAVSRGDAVFLIDRYIARTIISDATVIQEIIERDDIRLLGALALKLDRGHQNWKVLARQLGVPSRILRNFGSHQRQNNALLMLKYLPIFDPDLTVDSLKDSCKAVELLEVVKVLDASGVPGEDFIMDILEDTDVIDELTDILNEENQGEQIWKKLARELNIPEEKFSIFEPSKQNSPTKLLLQSIAQCEPDITVDELLLALVAMKRHDVIDTLGKHFNNSDIRSILEENNCLPPQPVTPAREDQESVA